MDEFRRIRRRQQRSRNAGLVAVILIILFITILLIGRILGQAKPTPRLMFLSQDRVIESISTRALIVRHETSIASPVNGISRPVVVEGSKVASGQKLATIWPSDQHAALRDLQKAEKDVVDAQFDLMYTEQGKELRQVYENSEQAVRSLIDQIRSGTVEADLRPLGLLETSLDLVLQKRSAELRRVHIADPKLEDLLSVYNQNFRQLGAELAEVTSTGSGLVSYRTDGLEAALRPDILLTENPERLLSFVNSTERMPLAASDAVTADKPFLRLVGGFEQYFVLQIPTAEAESIAIGDYLAVHIPDLDLLVEDCEVIRLEAFARKTLLILCSDKQVEALRDFRVVTLDLHLHQRTGLRIPRTAFVNYNAKLQTGQVLQVVSGYTRREDVAVTAINAEYALIESLPGASNPLAVSSIIVLNPQEVNADEHIRR